MYTEKLYTQRHQILEYHTWSKKKKLQYKIGKKQETIKSNQNFFLKNNMGILGVKYIIIEI